MERLPTEIWGEIAEYCDGFTARKLARTCWKMARSEIVRRAAEKGLKKEIEDFMCRREKFSNGLVWFVRRFPEAFDYKFYLATREEHDIEVVRHFKANWPWRGISTVSRYDNAVLEVYQDELTAEDWREVSLDNFYLHDDEYLERWQEKLDWDRISECMNISVKTMKRFRDQINWTLFSRNVHLNSQHVDTFANMLDWDAISRRNDVVWLDPKWYSRINMSVSPLWIFFEYKMREQKEGWIEWAKFVGMLVVTYTCADLVRRVIN